MYSVGHAWKLSFLCVFQKGMWVELDAQTQVALRREAKLGKKK
jgi:hypothetical protein